MARHGSEQATHPFRARWLCLDRECKEKREITKQSKRERQFFWDAAFALCKMNCTLGFCWQCLRSTHQKADMLATSTEEVLSCAQALRGARLS